ncbi:uncharacterized protein LOC144542977 isoform X1 [Centroberyx gerrardi]
MKIQILREFINERLTAAAEEIFGIVEKTIAEYEEAFRSKLNEHKSIVLKPRTGKETEMSLVQLRRTHVSKRLAAAAEEILGFVEETVAEYQEETDRAKEKETEHRNKLLEQEKPFKRADPQQLSKCVCERRLPPAEDRSQVDPLQLKEEQEEVHINQNNIMKVTVPPMSVEFVHNRDRAHSSRFRRTQDGQNREADLQTGGSAERRESELNGESCGVSEAASDCQDNNSDCSELENEDRNGGWREGGEHILSLTTQILKKQIFGISSKCKKSTEPSHPKSVHLSRGVSYCCKLCGKSFSYKGFLINHIQKHEADATICGVCGKCLEPDMNLMSHLQTHAQETEVCHICGKQFGTINALEKHIGAHTGDMPYKCLVCEKGFDHSGHLKTHMRTHTGEKPFVCNTCGKAYTQNGNLMAHMRAHTGEKPYACSFCDKAFHRNGLLQTHMRIHTGDRPYVCAVCGKGFSDNRNLKRHSMAHTGEQPYSCGLCGKGFKQNQHLKYHMANHTGEKPFKCEVCAKGFVLENDLRRHVKTHSEKRREMKSGDVEKDSAGLES